MLTLKSRHNGFILIENLVGLLVGLFILAATIMAFSGLSQYTNDTLRTIRLEHELRTALTLMANDVRRSGYWALAPSDVGKGKNNNPFMKAETDLRVVSNNCILFSYDITKNGVLPPLNQANGDKRFGYRLSNGMIQTRRIASPVFDCNDSAWDDLTNNALINISQLSFNITKNSTELNGPGSDKIESRTVNITITGSLIADPSVTRTYSDVVRVRNDKFIPKT